MSDKRQVLLDLGWSEEIADALLGGHFVEGEPADDRRPEASLVSTSNVSPDSMTLMLSTGDSLELGR